ncbi:MAG: hypothetical protein WBH28_18145 [Fuerstiella sp.]|mgnify:CR=1 FL=1
MELAKQTEAAVEAGKLSKEDAKKRLVDLRMKFFHQEEPEGRD